MSKTTAQFKNLMTLKRKLEGIRRMKVEVGLIGNPKNKDGVAVVDYATWNEKGTDTIPARPFWRTTFTKYMDDIENFTAKRLKTYLKVSSKENPELFYRGCGIYVQGKIRYNIKFGNWAPNAESTRKKKGDKDPLIDTGFLISKIGYEVKRR